MKRKTAILGIFAIVMLTASISFGDKSKQKPPVSLLSVKHYTKLKPVQRAAYIKGLKKALLTFETNFGIQKFSNLMSPWLETSHADEKTYCMIGDRLFARDSDKRCPTRKAPCKPPGGGEASTGFQCGKLYQEICITRKPLKDLSKRCQAGLPEEGLLPADYEKVYRLYTEHFSHNSEVCSASVRKKSTSSCYLLDESIQILKNRFAASIDNTSQAVAPFGDDGATAAASTGGCGNGLNPFCANTFSLPGSSFSDIDFKARLCGNPEIKFQSPDGFTRRIFKDKNGKPCQAISKNYDGDSSLGEASKGIGGIKKYKGKCTQLATCIKDVTRTLRDNIKTFKSKNSKAISGRGFCKGWGQAGGLGCPPDKAQEACKPLTRGDSPCKIATIGTKWGELNLKPDNLLRQLSPIIAKSKGDSNVCSAAIGKCLDAVKEIEKVANPGVASRTLCGGKWWSASNPVAVGPYSAEKSLIKDKGKVIAKIGVSSDWKAASIASTKRSGAALRIPAGSDNFDIQAWTQKEGGTQTGSASTPRGLACSDAPICNSETDIKKFDLASKNFSVKAGTPLCVQENSSSNNRNGQQPETVQ